MTDLLGTGSCYAPYANDIGIVQSRKYRNWQAEAADQRWSTREGLNLSWPINESQGWESMYNKIVVRNLAPEREPIYGIAQINDPTNPLHRDTLGMELAQVIDDPQVPDQAAAQQRADLLMADGASRQRKIDATTIVDMDAQPHDMIDMDVWWGNEQVIGGKWIRRQWKTIVRGVTATTDSQLTRVENWR
jgi:hypothetical protein